MPVTYQDPDEIYKCVFQYIGKLEHRVIYVKNYRSLCT